MARPYILIEKETLIEIEGLHNKGVPVSKLIRDFNLTIASPTLQRLISYINIAHTSYEENDTLKETVYKSLFPAWLDGADGVEISQPPDWCYKGLMPLGEWLKR